MRAEDDINKAYEQAKNFNEKLWEKIKKNPSDYRVLTGERPTGALHIGHFFGTLQNRLRLQDMGVELWIIIADYQVITDREASKSIKQNVIEVMADYLSIGLDPNKFENTTIFAHSYVPPLNQLLLPFLSLVPQGDLNRNPTVKSEVQSAGLKSVNALMYTYPVHQAADILFCHGNLVPGGKDQLPHIELTREIARRFNERYCPEDEPYFKEPHILLSKAPMLLGLDGKKMGKSANNAIFLRSTADETKNLIKKAKTDSDRQITYDPESRPEVANLLLLISLCTGDEPEKIANEIGDGGAGALKSRLTEAVNEYFKDARAKRIELIKEKKYLIDVLKQGNEKACKVGYKTLGKVQKRLGMAVY